MLRSTFNLRAHSGRPLGKFVPAILPNTTTMSTLWLAGAGCPIRLQTCHLTLTSFGQHSGKRARVGLGPLIIACTETWRLPRRSMLLSSVVTSQFCRAQGGEVQAAMADSKKNEDQPKSFKYIQLWVSEDGETHVEECKMTGFDKKSYSSLDQWVRSDFGGSPQKITFTELPVGLEQPLHTCPQVQFVITLSGSWYIKTTDGTKYIFKPGEVLFQDNTDNNPAKKTGQHYSGVSGDVPCQQFIIQFDRPPETNNPNAF